MNQLQAEIGRCTQPRLNGNRRCLLLYNFRIAVNNWPISPHSSSEAIGKKLYFFQLDFYQEAGSRLQR